MKVKSTVGPLLAPLPTVMVSCGRKGDTPNIVTIAWAGTVNSEPPMCSVSVRKNPPSLNKFARELRGMSDLKQKQKRDNVYYLVKKVG